MTQTKINLVSSGASSAGDAEAIGHFKQALAGGRHWYLAMLGAFGLWSSAVEDYNQRSYCYLIDGEAFDWLLLAERLCETVDDLLPEDEKNALLFQGIPPLALNAAEVKQLIGEKKYGQYLNYFYGVTVEEALGMAVQEEVDKERRVVGLRSKAGSTDELYIRLYDAPRDALLSQFRQEKGYAQLKSTNLTELKEFNYWLFKYRLKRCEKARIASDTKKALEYLKRHWQKTGVCRLLATDFNPSLPV
ncbi:MAG: hypothetical protein ABR958_02985 [Dehalococcoidales bacterium]